MSFESVEPSGTVLSTYVLKSPGHRGVILEDCSAESRVCSQQNCISSFTFITCCCSRKNVISAHLFWVKPEGHVTTSLGVSGRALAKHLLQHKFTKRKLDGAAQRRHKRVTAAELQRSYSISNVLLEACENYSPTHWGGSVLCLWVPSPNKFNPLTQVLHALETSVTL